MLRKIFLLLVLGVFFLISASSVSAAVGAGDECKPGPVDPCVDGYSCQREDEKTFLCQKNVVGKIFGRIQPPEALKGLISQDPTGAGGIGKFLSNLIGLIYIIAAIVFILMIIWGSFDWITSEGDKEKLQGAQRKIINALIGIMLFAVAFAVIRVFGIFTGFKFFIGQ